MKERIEHIGMEDWLVRMLNYYGYYYVEDILSRSESELLDEGVSPGTMRQLILFLNTKGLILRGQESSLVRVGLRKSSLERLHAYGIHNLYDLMNSTWAELAYDAGMGEKMANWISRKMNQLKLPLIG